jgi:hypothetical protein
MRDIASITATGGKSTRGYTYGLVGDTDTTDVQKGNGIIIDNGEIYKSDEYREETTEYLAEKIATAFYEFIKYSKYYLHLN